MTFDFRDVGFVASLGKNTFNSLHGDAGLVAYYKFDEASGNIINQSLDSTKIANSDIVITGATYSATGKIGNALSFDGINDSGITSSSAIADWKFLHNTGFDVSISVWIYVDNTSAGTRGIVATMNGNSSDNGFLFFQSGNLVKIISQVGTTSQFFASTNTLTASAWNHVVLTINETTNDVKIYINNSVDTGASYNKTSTVNPESVMGIMWDTQSGSYLPGDIDELTIFKDRVLTSAEVSSLYNSGNGMEIY